MAQYEMNLRDYWFIIRRRRATIMMSTVLVALFSFWFAQQKVPQYQTTAAVKFEPSTALSGLLVEVLSYSSADSIETQTTLIKSTPILEEVARQLGRLPEARRGEPLQETREYRVALDSINAKLKVTRVPNTSILEITATSADPVEAKQLANLVAQVYRRYSRDSRNTRIIEARKFIEAQLREVEGRLKRAEDELWAFRDANRVIAPGAESTVLLSLFTQVRGDIEKTRQQRTELELALARIGRGDPASITDPVVVETVNPAIRRLQEAQNELLLERNNLALEVTDRHPRLMAVDDRLREVRVELKRQVTAQIAALRNREEILNRQLGELFQKNREVPAVELGLQRRQRDAKVNDDLLTLLKAKHQEALIKESEAIEEVTLVRPAPEPDAPAGTEKLNTVVAGALLGLLLGVVLAFVQETLDTSIGTIEDVETYLEVPVLGVVPHIDARETTQRLIERRPAVAQMDAEALRNHALLITHFDPKSPVAEAYRTLRTNIQFARLEQSGKTLLVTSPTLQEGKTTTIVNLALTMAQNGQKTLLLGANLRRPSIHRVFGIEREPGLSDILLGKTAWRDCIRTVADILMGRFEMEDIMASPGLDNLHIIESGPVPANPSELLSTRAMAEFLAAVRNDYDIVLVDAPPVLPVTDSAIIAAQVDGVVLVYQAGKVGRLVLKRAKVHLESVGGKVWGVVLNDVHTEITGYQYTHYYTHYYGEETSTEPAAAGRLDRLWATVRARMRTGGSEAGKETAVAEPRETRATRRDESRTRSGPKRSRFWVLFGVVFVAALSGFGTWRAGWLGGEPARRVLFRQKLETGAVSRPAPRPMTPSRETATGPTEPVGPSTPDLAPTAGRVPSSAPEAAPVAQPERTTAAAPATADAPTPRTERAAATSSTAPSPRFAVEFGPFVTTADAERTERTLTGAGYQTVRFRQQTGSAVYAVVVERIPTAREAQALVASLRGEGFGDAVVLGDADSASVRVGEPLPLRGAVQLAERLRRAGHQVRIAAEPGEAVTFVIRHGNFTSREEAEAKRHEFLGLGLPNQAVQVK
jgi:polysaccharide biosynthesis transport protein